MSQSEFDIGPLTWVKGEIDAAVLRAKEQVAHFAANISDTTALRFAQPHLHQVKGAIQMVGLDGVARFVEELENFMRSLEAREIEAAAETLDLLDQGLNAIGKYLDELMGGAPDVPLKLFPVYKKLLEARKVERISESDLFFPDLSVRVAAGSDAVPVVEAELPRYVRNLRTKYQKGLLSYLKNPQDTAGLHTMREALAQIESTQQQPASRTFWWSTVAFVEGLQQGGVAPQFNVKSLCGRIDQQIRRVVENSAKVAEKLNRDVLYYVASAKPVTERLQQVRSTFQLDAHLPQEQASTPGDQALEKLKPTLRDMAELIAGAKEAWLKYTAGNQDALKVFQDQARRAVNKSETLAFAPLAGLLEKIAAGAEALGQETSETVAMEMATALLLSENAAQNFTHLTPEFTHQAEVQGRRLQASLSGESTADIEEVPLLDEISRKAQEKLLLAQIGTEIQTNLRHIEQVLDAFFRDHNKRADIPGLTSYVRQIFGALSILELERAADLLNACQLIIDKFADPAQMPQQRDMELVAEGLSSLGFYIEAVQHGRDDAFNIIAPIIKTFPGIRNKDVREADQHAVESVETAAPIVEAPVASVEAGMEEQKSKARALFEAWQASPDAESRTVLRAQLTTLMQDADLIDDQALKERAGKTLAALDQAVDVASPELTQLVTELTAPKVAAVAPSQETARLLDASKEVIDRELLETYLEEANEVLATISEQLGLLRRRPHDHDALVTIRRGFHTLKGSGRMVGLTDLGEVAWGIEQTMNRWLEEEKDASPELMDMIQHAHDAFAGWVELLTLDGAVQVDATVLLQEAAALREDPSGPFDLSAKREALLASRLAVPQTEESSAIEQPFEMVDAPTAMDELPQTEEEMLLEPMGDGEFTLEFTGLEESSEEISLEADAILPEEVAPITPELQAIVEELPVMTPTEEPQEVRIGEVSVSPSLYQLFLDEAATHSAILEECAAALQQNPAQPVSYETMRAAHTLAGISSTVGFKPLSDLAHAFEHWLMDVMHNPRTLQEEDLQLLRDAMTSIKAMAALIKHRAYPEAATELISRLEQKVIDARIAREQVEVDISPAAEPATAESLEKPAPLHVVSSQQLAPAPHLTPVPAIVRAPKQISKAAASLLDFNIRDDVDEQLLPVFLEEAEELMPFIGTQLRAWRETPLDASAPQGLNRALHTLKGSARMAGAMRLGDLTHRMEERVLVVTEDELNGSTLFDELEDYFDALGDVHEALIHGETIEQPEAGEAPVSTPTPAAASAVAPVVLGLAQQPATLPQAGTLAEMEQAAARAMLRVRADTVDRLVNEAGEVSITRSRVEGELLHFKHSLKELTENVIRLRGQLREIEIQAESQMQSRISAAQDTQFDPLEFDRFTRLQEVTRMMAESVNDVSTVQLTMLKNLDEAEAALIAQSRLNRELQQSLMHIRMVPLSSITERLHRIVRQTAKEVGKKAVLAVEGESVELDRSVLEKMTAPFEHLLRNAVSHGIEGEQARQAAGKSESGTIELKARQEGNEVILILRDDGGGINLERVRAKGIEQGLIGAEEEAPPNKLMELIFNAGFSTAAEVTQISGRGVGMDVVRNEIASLGGRIEVASEAGQGTIFTVYLPLTLAVTQVVMVRSGENQFAVPASMVEQVQEVKPKKLSEIYQQGLVNWLGNDYPLHYLPRLLGDEDTMPEAKTFSSIMLLRSGTHRAAVHVDTLERNQEVVIKNIGPQLARVSGISGATVLGNGHIVLIINPVQLAHRETPHAQHLPAPAKTQELVTTPVIMVVDDSLTVRKITGRLLAKEGYQVLTAKDGVDALQQLQDVKPAVMLVDIEMPRMDGFELTKNVRGDAVTADIPIIMITSRTAEKHRNYAKELGVNVYLGKPYQEDELLSHIAGFVQGAKTPATV